MRRRTQTTSRRAGFTLVELILALGLTITLLTAVYSAMELHWKFSTLGRIEVERAQVARQLLTMMSSDIRSATFSIEDVYGSDAAPSEDDGFSDDGTDSSDDGFSTGTDDETEATMTADPFQFAEPGLAFTGASSGVYGDAGTLVIHMSRPYRERNRADLTASSLSKSDLKSVAYFLAEGDGMLSLTAQTYLVSSDGPQEGLVRMDSDPFSLALSEAESDPLENVSKIRVLAEEIEYISFEYHDGYEWVTEWDSTYQGRLPNAIGITLGFRAPEYAEGSIFAREPSKSTDTFRIVVPLVASAPFQGLSTF